MPKFLFTPASGDPFAVAQEYASEIGGAPRGPATMAAIGSAFGRDMQRLVSAPIGALNTVGNALSGDTQVEIGPDGSVSPIDPRLVDAAGTLSGFAAEGGFAMPKPEGALGVFAGRTAKTADLAALRTAQAADAMKIPPHTIWKQTGWFKGADDQWRFEIPDEQAGFRSGVLQNEQQATADREWHRENEATKLGYFDWSDLNRNGTKEEIDAVVKAANEQSGYSSTLGNLLYHDKLFEAYPDLKNRPVFSISDRPYSGQYSPAGDFFDIDPTHPGQGLTIALHEVQHAIQGREGFGGGGSPRDPQLYNAGAQVAAKMSNTLQDLKAKPIKSEDDVAEIMYLTKAVAQIQERPFGDLGYHTLSGEVEARNVENRLAWKDYGMYQKDPWTTEDVPREFQNVRVERNMLVPAGVKR